ncbi:MAG TPA: sugar ABC transporter permease, partial [Anaerolineae bacterium]|nr:sugar ABC transporter permease [Anaerolineae bacterium]
NQIFVLYSVPVYSVADIIDTWVYRSGVLDFQFSLATAVGLFKGVIGLILILVANRVAKRLAQQTLF